MVRTINLTFDPDTLGLVADGDLAGTTADVGSTIFRIAPVEGAVIDLVADMSVVVGGIVLKSPFARFDSEGSTSIPPYILREARGSIELSVRYTYDDGRVVNSQQIILACTQVPADGPVAESPDLVFTRNSSWDWVPGWEYPKGAVVAYNGILYTSTSNGNRGNVPGSGDEWMMSVDAQKIADLIGEGINQRLDGVETAIDAVAEDLAEATETLSADIAAETDRAQQAEQALQQAIDAKEFPIEDTVTSDGQNAVKSAGIASYVGTKMSEATTTLNSAIISETARAMARENEIEAIARGKSSEITTYAGTVGSVGALNSLNAEIGDYAIVENDGTYLKDTSGWIKISGLDARWGNVQGSITAQTDLINAIATAKSEAVATADANAEQMVAELSDELDTKADRTDVEAIDTRVTALEQRPAGNSEWGQIGGAITDQADLTEAIATAKSEAVQMAGTDADAKYQTKGNYALMSDIPDLTPYVTQSQLNDGLSGKQDIGDYVTDTEFTEEVTRLETRIDVKADKSEISDMLTRSEASTTYQPVGAYLKLADTDERYQPKGDYALRSEITTVYRYKGTVDTVDDLPDNAEVGDVWNVSGENGQNYAYTDEGWDSLGATVDLSNYATKDDLEDVKVDPSVIIVTSESQPADRVGLWIQPTATIPNYDEVGF